MHTDTDSARPARGDDAPLDAGAFARRLAKLCLTGGGYGLPSRPRDRAIVFKAATLALDPARTHTEREINEALAAFLRDVGPSLASDHVSLRRALVDERWLERESGGAWYRVGAEALAGDRFASDVDALVPARVIAEARADRDARRRAHAPGAGDAGR